MFPLLFSSLLYSFKVSALPSCSLFSFLLIKAFSLYLLVSSSLLFSTHSKLLLYPLCFPFPFLLYPIKASSLPSCSSFSFLLYSFKVSSLPSCFLFSFLVLYLLVSSSLLFSTHLKASSLPSCSPFSSLPYLFKASSLLIQGFLSLLIQGFFSTFLFPFSSVIIQGLFSTFLFQSLYLHFIFIRCFSFLFYFLFSGLTIGYSGR